MFVLIKMKNLTAHINLKNKILRKKNIISIMGLGYVGLPLAMAFCSSKIKTIGYDVNKKRVSSLKNNKSYISSVGNNTLKRSQKYFTQTSNIKDLEKSDVIIVCVPTPINEISKIPNLDYVKELGFEIKKTLLKGDCAEFGKLMNQHWKHKLKRSKNMSNQKINETYDYAIRNGAIGGKLIGAGGGGFLLFYTNSPTKLRKAMLQKKMEEVRFKFDFEGVKQIL